MSDELSEQTTPAEENISGKQQPQASTIAENAARVQSPDVEAVLQKIQEDAEAASSTLAVIKKSSADASETTGRLQQTEATATQTLSVIQARLTEASGAAASANEKVTAITQLESQYSELGIKIGELKTTAEAALAEVTPILSNVKSSETEAKASEQAAATAAANTSTQERIATEAAAKTTGNQTESTTILGDIRSLNDQVQKFKEQTESAAASAKDSYINAGRSANLAKASAEAASGNQSLIEKALQTAQTSSEKITENEKAALTSAAKISELEETIEKRGDEIAEWHVRYKALEKRINDLLPMATNATLATAFREQKTSSTWTKWIAVGLFVVAAGVLSYDTVFWELMQPAVPRNISLLSLFAEFLHRAPLYVPCVLVAFLAFRIYSNAEKIEQDYAYKERMATTFEGFKRHFAEVPTVAGQEPLLNSLCNKLLDTIGSSPTRFFERKPESLPPIEPLDKMSESADKLIEGVFRTSKGTDTPAGERTEVLVTPPTPPSE